MTSDRGHTYLRSPAWLLALQKFALPPPRRNLTQRDPSLSNPS